MSPESGNHRPVRPLLFPALAALFVLPLAGGPGPDQLYMPRNVTATYQAGTRSLDGKPGPNYWENHGHYDIDITVNPPNPVIHGRERITYFNNSPDSLKYLTFKLFLNAHKAGAARNGPVPAANFTDGVQVDSFAVNGATRSWGNDARTGTVKRVFLPKALAPHDSVELAINWHVELSKGRGREGIIDPTTFYMAYFYPRVAVYDDYNGWDTMEFTGSQEFYSDFNNYTVTVHAPANFVVWGTGTLQQPERLLQPAVLERYQASFTADSVIHVATLAQMKAKQVTTSGGQLAWTFKADNIPDMAFGVSDHYEWDAGSVIVDSSTMRRASVQAAYQQGTVDYPHMVRFAKQSLSWLSHNLPGVPYPYPKTTIFQGFADMEYPMMVNDNTSNDTTFAHFVVAHELAHTWFPFYMGINETRYGFMDEGWATTFEYLINQANMGPEQAATLYKQFRVARWINDPSPSAELPIITPEDILREGAGNNAYGKSSLGYLAVRDLLGHAEFKTALHEFISRWHGKHPSPWDFFYTINDATGRNLDWFWRDWFFRNSYIDLAIENVGNIGGATHVTVKNIGGMPAPFNLILGHPDGSSSTVHETPAVWQADQSTATVTLPSGSAVSSIRIDGGIWMDADTTNNVWRAP